jgi:ribonuclease E
MTKRMLIDATHAEETRVVVLDGNRLEDFDVETSTKKQLKGNIYLAKVVRVEPSLQAAFVEYGGGRHGFLAFGEIHPDYYQIPVADRQRLLEIAAEEAREEEEAEDRLQEALERGVGQTVTIDAVAEKEEAADWQPDSFAPAQDGNAAAGMAEEVRYGEAPEDLSDAELISADDAARDTPDSDNESSDSESSDSESSDTLELAEAREPPPEQLGGTGDQFEGNGAEEATRRRSSRMLRSYRIQEVIRRRQILLIQVVKEERGNKGAALTTYISLAGRYCVLMPNSPRGGGISRKITSAADRKRLKEITSEMEIPKGMGLIVRTAGANRPKPEIKRDCEYLMRLWDEIRELTMRSMAPALIYEEASLIKRSIRDVYSRDVEEVIVDGEEGWKQARDFMRMLMPSHANKVQLWRPQGIATPLFAKYQVDLQLDAMMSPTVQLRSGGYLVINQTEALVAIDVNSGRSTRERGIEETALKTNLEAADEIARQLRLRDLAGLIVIDFIDMEARKANSMVERRMKEALKNDRARIQIGAISHFGLMEMSRQRLRPSLAETSFVTCPHCNGLGHVRSVESSAIHVLRAVEEEGAKLRATAILVYAAPAVVMYILNNKRDRLTEIEARYAMRVSFAGDDTLLAPATRIERLRPQVADAERLLMAAPVVVETPPMIEEVEEEEADIVTEEAPREAISAEEAEQRKRRRRRRRGGRREGQPGGEPREGGEAGEEEGEAEEAGAEKPAPEEGAEEAPAEGMIEAAGEGAAGEADERGRRRGRRGGRRRRRGEPAEGPAEPVSEGEVPPAPPAYTPPPYSGPTPANPFNTGYDIFDILDRVEEASKPEVRPELRQVPILPHPPVAAPEEAAPEVLAEAQVVTPEPVAEPVAEAPPEAVAEIAPETAPVAAEPEAPAEPTEPPPPPKRGWWRR